MMRNLILQSWNAVAASVLICSSLVFTAPAHAVSRYKMVDLGESIGFGAMNNAGLLIGNAGYYGGGGWEGSAYLVDGATGAVLKETPGARYDGLNDLGHIVGIQGGTPVLWRDGGVTPLDAFSSVTGINNAGAISGYMWSGEQATGIVQRDEGIVHLAQLGLDSFPHVINENGVVIGLVAMQPAAEFYAGRWNPDGSGELLPSLGTMYYYANDINDHGIVVGEVPYNDDFHTRPVMWTQDGLVDLAPDFDGYRMVATGINNAGQITGWSHDTDTQSDTAWLWEEGHRIALDTLVVGSDMRLSHASAINDKGWILGSANDLADRRHSVMLIPLPVPEPAAMLMVLCGVGVVMLRTSRRRDRAKL